MRQLMICAGAALVPALGLYPQPAAPGGTVRLVLARPGRGPVQVQLLDTLGRTVAALATAVSDGELQLTLPASPAPSLYAVRVQAPGQPAAMARLLVQAP